MSARLEVAVLVSCGLAVLWALFGHPLGLVGLAVVWVLGTWQRRGGGGAPPS